MGLMRGRVPPRPVEEIAEAAAKVFMAKGYRAAGISDVSAALKMSHGAVYTYAKSKEALLYLALLRLARPDVVPDLQIPVATPTPETIAAVVRDVAAGHGGLTALAAASSSRPRVPVAEEFAGIVDELYALTCRFPLSGGARGRLRAAGGCQLWSSPRLMAARLSRPDAGRRYRRCGRRRW